MVRATRSRRAASKKADKDKDNDSPAEKPATRRGRRSKLYKLRPREEGREERVGMQKASEGCEEGGKGAGGTLFSGGRDAGDSIHDDFEVEYVAPPSEMILDTLKRFGNPGSSSAPEEERAHGSRSGDEGQGNDGDTKIRRVNYGVKETEERDEEDDYWRVEAGLFGARVVEVWDVTAMDPLMLVYLKAYRNTVPVPRHWSQKRKYLQGKRGLEKPPFKLPAFIAATGIGEMRQAYLEKAEEQNMKSRGRERTQPKMGKLDIDYRVLYDAFFRHQQKPLLSNPGELYYEGKEFETAHLKKFRPGVLSDSLSEALGVQRGAPPPWLVAMQRYGPPPSYTSLRIPGLNAPIPPNAQFGYHPGGWGKPPVDEFGNPIYGDVFGEQVDDEEEEDIHVIHWGEADEEEEEEETEQEEVFESDEDAERRRREEEEEDKAHVAGDEAEQIAGHISGLEPLLKCKYERKIPLIASRSSFIKY
eukprot:jgi/Picre1/32317/NNA_007663.t1